MSIASKTVAQAVKEYDAAVKFCNGVAGKLREYEADFARSFREYCKGLGLDLEAAIAAKVAALKALENARAAAMPMPASPKAATPIEPPAASPTMAVAAGE